MPFNKSIDIATFYTELAEVSLTNSLLYIRLLDSEPDSNELERHRRKLTAMIPARAYPSLIDLRDTEFDLSNRLALLLPHTKSGTKIAVLTNRALEIPKGINMLIFYDLVRALEWLKSV